MNQDTNRLPPGQYLTRGFPVLHAGFVPPLRKDQWDFRVFGLVETEQRWSWEDMQQLPRTQVHCDIHCVTKWTKFDTVWEGIPVRAVFDLIKPRPEARHVMVHADPDYSTNIPLDELLHEDVLLADTYDGKPLTPDHGGPMRLLVPKLYFWKSAKWVRGFELMAAEEPGYWERNGYHIHGDPWKMERYDSDHKR